MSDVADKKHTDGNYCGFALFLVVEDDGLELVIAIEFEALAVLLEIRGVAFGVINWFAAELLKLFGPALFFKNSGEFSF